jgi:hypothetical protein
MTLSATHILDSASFSILIASNLMPEIAESLGIRFCIVKQAMRHVTHLYSVVDGKRGPREPIRLERELHSGALQILDHFNPDLFSATIQWHEYQRLSTGAAVTLAAANIFGYAFVCDDLRLASILLSENFSIVSVRSSYLLRSYLELKNEQTNSSISSIADFIKIRTANHILSFN